MNDFDTSVIGTAPAGYPERPNPDRYAREPFAESYEERRRALFAFWKENPAGTGIKAHFPEILRLAGGFAPVHTGLFRGAVDYINRRQDCADFVMLGIVRVLYQFPPTVFFPSSETPSPGPDPLGTELREDMRRSLLNFKYHPEEPGSDSLCTWTENHQIMFAASAFLAGQLYRDETFSNTGERGREKMKRARSRILQWLDLRYRTGFSEWLSHVYYDEDMTALANLIDFAEDPEIVRRSEIVLDLLLLDVALNSFRGTFGSSHGRSYREEKQDGAAESTTDTSKLLFGTGVFRGRDNMSAVTLALSSYRCPAAIVALARDTETSFENRQRAGIRISEAARWGLSTRRGDVESAMALLSLEAYTHPRTIMQVMDLFDRFRWWENEFFRPFARYRRLITTLRRLRLLPLLARLSEKDLTRNTREEVNILSHRSPDAMLSTAQDWRPGYGGDQQHILQATLSPKAVVFTTHPGSLRDESPGYWVGSGTLPRAVQVGSVAVAIYRASRTPGLYVTNSVFSTHAWFPADAFDEIAEAPHGETPAWSGETPARSGETPARSGEPPARSGEPPAGHEDPPARSGETPTLSGETPTPDGETPAWSGETPARSGETPAWSGETPPADGETPARSGETPARSGDPPARDRHSRAGAATAPGAWIFGRRGDGYVALYSRNGYYWQSEGPDAGREVIAPGRSNIWILEIGRRETDGAFQDFIRRRLEADIAHRGLRLHYKRPGLGTLQVGWRGTPRLDGTAIRTREYPRYENPFVQASFPPNAVEVRAGGWCLWLDFDSGIRAESARYAGDC